MLNKDMIFKRSFALLFLATILILTLFTLGCDSGSSSFSGTYKYDHVEKDFASDEPTLKLEELTELTQNGTSITGNYTRVVTPVRFSNCSVSVKASIACALSENNIAQCTFPQYAEKEVLCDQSAIYSSAIGCGRASVDCVPFTAKIKDNGQTILIEVPEFEMHGIFWEARTWEMKRRSESKP